MWESWRSKSRHHISRRPSGIRGAPSASESEPQSPDLQPQRVPSGTVNFKDLNLGPNDVHSSSEDESLDVTPGRDPLGLERTRRRNLTVPSPRAQRNRLIIVMVGLPGRGKTFLCNKLVHFLSWLGHDTHHFNVGKYRRCRKDDDGLVQDASFFDHNNPAGMEARERSVQAALEDMLRYLASSHGQVAIFDATNTTRARRQALVERFHGKYQYLFIESICNDKAVLEQNYMHKMMYSPDYSGVDTEKALEDFHQRVDKYDEVYESIDDRSIHYIKLIDMVTGRGHMDINRISGYIPGKIVFFLMQICKAGMNSERKIWLSRHGQSEWNLQGKLGGDSSLTPLGAQYARLLPDILLDRLPTDAEGAPLPLSVWTSTLVRTIRTALHLPFPKLRWKALDEIHAGICDGLTYEQVAEKYPEEYAARKQDKLTYRYPAGESYMDVIQRLEPVIIEMERERESICIVGHQAVLRVVYAYFMKVPLKKLPTLSIPLHSLLELTPRPDGTMVAQMIKVDVEGGGGGHLVQPSAAVATQSEGSVYAVPPSGMGLTPTPPVAAPMRRSNEAWLAASKSPGCGSLHDAAMGPAATAVLMHARGAGSDAGAPTNSGSTDGVEGGVRRAEGFSRGSTGDMGRSPSLNGLTLPGGISTGASPTAASLRNSISQSRLHGAADMSASGSHALDGLLMRQMSHSTQPGGGSGSDLPSLAPVAAGMPGLTGFEAEDAGTHLDGYEDDIKPGHSPPRLADSPTSHTKRTFVSKFAQSATDVFDPIQDDASDRSDNTFK